MKTAHILIGVPASGKSTWVNQNTDALTMVISTDNHIQEFADANGKTYSEVFDYYIKTAQKEMFTDLAYAVDHDFNIIWDQTNTSVKARKSKIQKLGSYFKIAVVFKTPEPEELDRRLNSRVGKHIPTSVIKSMIESFEYPTLDEGFDKIIEVS